MGMSYDDALKKLFRANMQDFVDLLHLHLSVKKNLPIDLGANIYADKLVCCHDAQGQEILAHFEFQPEKDVRMGERLLEYNILASCMNDYAPVYSCVIYLKSSEGMPRSPFIRTLPSGMVTTSFYYTSIELATIPVEKWLAADKPGLLPLLPFTKGGHTREAVHTMVLRLNKKEQSDLLWIGLSLAERVLTDGDDLEWLRREKAGLHDVLKDSPTHQEAAAEAEVREKLQAMADTQEDLARVFPCIVTDRFPTLEALATDCANCAKTTYTALVHLATQVYVSHSEDQARTVLESYLNAS
jgi:hypothetical protein